MGEFVLTSEQASYLNRSKKKSTSGGKRGHPPGRFVRLPYPQILEIAAAIKCPEMAVLAYMVYRISHPRHQGTDIAVPNKPFTEAGFGKDAKGRGLKRLGRAGIAKIISHHRGRSPRATLPWIK
jgi:hypothetical protein